MGKHEHVAVVRLCRLRDRRDDWIFSGRGLVRLEVGSERFMRASPRFGSRDQLEVVDVWRCRVKLQHAAAAEQNKEENSGSILAKSFS